MGLYFGTLRVYDDHDRITTALFRVTGDAYKFFSPLIKKAGNGEPLGTWEDFTKSVMVQYGKMTDKEIAKKEIRGYYGTKGKELAESNYFNYCERFRTLGRLSETANETLVWEFTETLPEKVKDTLNVLGKTPFFKAPTDIEPLIDFALKYKIKGSIFEKAGKKDSAPAEKKETSSASAKKSEKKKDKGKAPAKAPADTANAVCTYCKQTGHYFNKCPKLAADKAAGTFVPAAQRAEQQRAKDAAAASGKTTAAPSGSGKGQASGKKPYSAPPRMARRIVPERSGKK
ncbi:hypothetical protein NW754_016280 [Fusarium falciforme]|nr:hypothetical protein NW754_016280 [Fusarium falciforme]